MCCVFKFTMYFNNLYGEIGNPLFECEGVVFERALMPSDMTGYLPDDLVVPIQGAALSNSDPLEARDVRSALWLCAGDIRKAAERLGVPLARVRAFVKNSPWVQRELYEARERILDRAEEVLLEALFSDDAKRRDSAALFILKKSEMGRQRMHALTDHLKLDPNADRPVIRWIE
jgi:hypothetical protein